MNRVVVVAGLLASSTGCHGWSKQDTLLEFGAMASLTIDERQTQAAIENRHMGESNPIIGDKAQNMSPATYFVSVGLLHIALAAIFPHGWVRSAFQLGTVGYETHIEYDNHQVFEYWRGFAVAAAARTR